jgi:hypothetical protein
MSVALRLPPPKTRPRGGGDSRWVPLCRTADDIEAHLLTGRLHQGGVETRTLKDRGAPGSWLYGGANPFAPVTVYVRSWQLDDARLTLAEVAFAAPDASHARDDVDGPSLKWWAIALLLGALLSSVVVAQMAGAAGACQLPVLCRGPVR